MKGVYSKNWTRKFFYFRSTSSKITGPLIVSVSLHLFLILLGYTGNEENSPTMLEINILSTADTMAIQKNTKFSKEKEEIHTIKKKFKKKDSGSDSPEIFSGPGSVEKSDNAEKLKSLRDEFLKNYESNLLNQKSTFEETVNRDAESKKDKINWEEVEYGISAQKKESTVEALRVPGGFGESKFFKWKEGYTRRLIFQPEIEYPFFFRKQGIQASVQLEIEVNSDGNVVSAEVLNSSGYSKLDILARNGILKARFAPRENTTSLYDRGEVEVQFRLNK